MQGQRLYVPPSDDHSPTGNKNQLEKIIDPQLHHLSESILSDIKRGVEPAEKGAQNTVLNLRYAL
jgi:hypothetical protein